MIDLNNYEQYALEYLDGELPPELLLEFERFLKKHPEIQDLLDEISETEPLPLFSYQYPNKQKLYRKEKNPGAYWYRWSIAASLLLMIGVGLMYILQNRTADSFMSEEETGISERHIDPGKTNHEIGKSRPDPEVKEPVTFPEMKNSDQFVSNEVKESEYDFQEDFIQNQDGKTVDLLDTEIIQVDEMVADKKLIDSSDLIATGKNDRQLVRFIDPIPLPQFELDHLAFHPSAIRVNRQLKNPVTEPRTIFIELPDEFFSESWRDLSLNNLKEKLVPDFLKTKSK